MAAAVEAAAAGSSTVKAAPAIRMSTCGFVVDLPAAVDATEGVTAVGHAMAVRGVVLPVTVAVVVAVVVVGDASDPVDVHGGVAVAAPAAPATPVPTATPATAPPPAAEQRGAGGESEAEHEAAH